MKLVVKIKKNFGSFKLDVDFSSEEKNISLLGQSGSGKSLTLKCIAGIIKPDSGYIEVNGRVLFDSEKHINVSPQKRKVGYLFQNYALFPMMTVRQNILVGLNATKGKEEKEKILEEYLVKYQLKKIEKKYPHQISGGEAQRVAIVRSLVAKPEILLLDEPFSALDGHLKSKLQMDLKGVLDNYAGQSILVSHDRDEAYLLSNETIVVTNGHNVINKNTKELFKNPETYEAAVITGCKNIVAASKEDDYSLNIPDWNIVIKFIEKLPEVVNYVGIRAHCFFKEKKDIKQEIRIIDITENPFENLVRFRFANQVNESEDIYWRIDKKIGIDKNLNFVYFDLEDVLLLK